MEIQMGAGEPILSSEPILPPLHIIMDEHNIGLYVTITMQPAHKLVFLLLNAGGLQYPHVDSVQLFGSEW